MKMNLWFTMGGCVVEILEMVLIGYVLLVNVLGFALMGIDKSRARRGAWRISEASLFLTAVVGGSIGCIAGMQVFRHKTKHRYFKYGMPVILVVQIVGISLLFQ